MKIAALFALALLVVAGCMTPGLRAESPLQAPSPLPTPHAPPPPSPLLP